MYIVCKCGMDGMFKEITLYEEQTKPGTENNVWKTLFVHWLGTGVYFTTTET